MWNTRVFHSGQIVACFLSNFGDSNVDQRATSVRSSIMRSVRRRHGCSDRASQHSELLGNSLTPRSPGDQARPGPARARARARARTGPIHYLTRRRSIQASDVCGLLTDPLARSGPQQFVYSSTICRQLQRQVTEKSPRGPNAYQLLPKCCTF